MISILTAPIRSGKTSFLKHFLAQKATDIDGFLSPDIEGKRHLFFLKNQQYLPFECDEGEDALSVGRFWFRKQAFDKAQECMQEALHDSPSIFVVDEVGKLELDNKGFEPLISQIVAHYQALSKEHKLILVVRDSLLEEVLKHYKISVFEYLKKK